MCVSSSLVGILQFGQSLLDLLEVRGIQLIFRRNWQGSGDLLLSSFDPLRHLGMRLNSLCPAAERVFLDELDPLQE